jgi:tRNA (adenine57-N1/adenine58-N1)-methyltransferase
LESGTGSGGLTTALAWAVGPAGKVISYDRRADMQALARKNLEMTGLAERVDLITQDIEEGLGEHDVDALFLDLPHPHLYLNSVRQVLTNGGTFGAILPTANQVSLLLQALEDHRFTMIDVCETILRFYKVVPQRFRPQDRMVAHTGYLIFARSLLESSGGQRQR